MLKKFFFFVGNIKQKKNLERLAQAYNLFKKNSHLQHKLVIVGKKAWKYKSFFNTILKLKLENDIIFTNYVPINDLPALFSMADLFVFPSLYEGFGIPPLEAMACEVPVLVSNKGALPEITGDNCLQVDPYNIQEIALGMQNLLTNHELRENSIQKGKKWTEKFSWEKTAKETLNIYNQVLNETVNYKTIKE